MTHAASEWQALLDFDRRHIWHPYTSIAAPGPVYPVERTEGCRIVLADGSVLIDGMSSWWCAIHGYNVPRINAAIADQVARMAHVMFGGLTHEPVVRLAEKLCDLVSPPLEVAFFADSGSVAVEVALKMAVQYWERRGRAARKRFLTIRGGYHGDTFGAMSVCDPDTGMHGMFRGYLPVQLFAAAPTVPFHAVWQASDLDSFAALLAAHHETIAAVILEPIVQGAGGMRFYHSEYLHGVRRLCEQWDVLLIADEIATGFGRTGRMFACDWAGIVPDILCLGKALTGGYMSLGATMTSRAIAEVIAPGSGQALMHGPTFMGNALTCAAANASLELLLESPWQERVARIEAQLRQELEPCSTLPAVRDVRVLGAIGVIEFHDPPDLHALTRAGVARGVWLRPFGRNLYTMPPFVIEQEELRQITAAMSELAALCH